MLSVSRQMCDSIPEMWTTSICCSTFIRGDDCRRELFGTLSNDPEESFGGVIIRSSSLDTAAFFEMFLHPVPHSATGQESSKY